MKLNKIIRDIEDVTQRLTSLQLSMDLLATYSGAFTAFTVDEFKNSSVSKEKLLKHWNQINNGEKLHSITEEIAIHSSKELVFLIYEVLEDVKEALQNINKLSNDII